MKFDPLHQILNIPSFRDDYKEATAKVLNSILLALFLTLSVLLIHRLVVGTREPDLTGYVLAGMLLMNLALWVAVRQGYVFQSGVILVVSIWGVITYQAWNANGIYDSVIVTYFIVILMAGFFSNWIVTVAITLLSIISTWGLAISRTGAVLHVASPVALARDLTFIFLLGGILILLLVKTLHEAREKTTREFNDRVHAEQVLFERDDRFRKVFHASPVAISLTALADGSLIEANEAFWMLTGFDPQESIGRTTVQLGIWQDEMQRSKFLENLLAKKSLREFDYELVRADGEKRFTTAFYELIDYELEPAILSMYYDTTEQKEMQAALHRGETRLQALLDAIPDMIFELKRDGTFLRFMPSPLSTPFVPSEEFIGKTIQQVLPSLAGQASFAIERALESGQLNAFEYQMENAGETKTFEARITPAGPDLVLAMVRDVSLNKWAEAEREDLINELETKNAELERFAYTVSHDLKAPLITIRGFLGFIREDANSNNQQRLEKDIQRISDATDKMQRLLGDLLELSRIGRLTNKPVFIPMQELVEEVLELLHGRIHSGNIKVRIGENLPSVFGDRQRIFEVFQNLIDNAAKFITDRSEPFIEVGQAGEVDNMPVFFVRDNGIGIAPQFRERIFGLFNKLDPLTDGTGIGLALVKRIVEFHGGKIWVESQPGDGATFFFTLPSKPKTER